MKQPLQKGFSKVLESVERYSPFMARQVAMKFINNMSPFNGHLDAKLQVWTQTQSMLAIKLKRAVKNHLGGIHAGALFTLGETCAGLILLKNFSPDKYRLILKSASVEYIKQARSECFGHSQISDKDKDKLNLDLAKLETVILPMETVIKNSDGEVLCTVRTEWQIKPWEAVRMV